MSDVPTIVTPAGGSCQAGSDRLASVPFQTLVGSHDVLRDAGAVEVLRVSIGRTFPPIDQETP